MKKALFSIIILVIFSFQGLIAQETFKLMFYNLLNFPKQEFPPNRIQYLEVILTEYQPDLFMVCELNSESAANDILSVFQNNFGTNYAKANFVNNTSDDATNNQNDLQNLLYYDSSKFVLESQTEIASIFRDFNHYKVKLNTVEQTSTPLFLDIIVCHLKASSGPDNEALRLQMINDLQTYLSGLPTNSNLILAGDFNMYSSDESGFIELTDATNPIVFVDPANRVGTWHNNSTYLDVFTQSTRTNSDLGGASGGFDDRFDFIMTSENMITNSDIYYVDDSYKVFGNNNNSNCFNRSVNSSDCAGADYSAFIRDALYNFSDHLPVTLQLQTNQSLSVNAFTYQQPIEIIGSNLIDTVLKLKINSNDVTNQTLNVYDNIGKLVKTINIKNSIYIVEDMSILANGLYYIVLPHLNIKPLKFVIAH